jgi:4-oxalocrotonate tautomerase
MPDVQTAVRLDDGCVPTVKKENAMFLVHVKLIEGALTGPQRQELVERVTDAVLASAGESMRRTTWCLVEEVPGDRWGIGGQTIELDDVRALARDGERPVSPG